MKKFYESAEIIITCFDTEEIITASNSYSVESTNPNDLPILPM